MRPRDWIYTGDGRRDYYDQCTDGFNSLLAKYEIEKPRCGSSVGLGWLPIVDEAFEKMIEAGWDKELHQVKQKFCGLRIYIGKGAYDDVDNPTRKFFRGIVHRLAGLGCKINHRLGMKLYDLRDSNLLRQWKPNAIALAIEEAELACDKICEVCGKEREKKGVSTGWALCNACGKEEEA